MNYEEQKRFELSLQIESYNKRMRSWKRGLHTRSGRLLIVLRERIWDDIKSNASLDVLAIEKQIQIIDKLSKRIERRHEREEARHFTQLQFIKAYKVTFIPPKRKRPKEKTVDATSHKNARSIIRDEFGARTQIISCKT